VPKPAIHDAGWPEVPAMKITIEYCGMWNYLPFATRAAAEIEEAIGETPILIEGSKGIFDVKADGKLIYSKYATNRQAEPGELARLLKASQPNP
jgi:selT/selW/selH-like putative selenoprotein